MTRDYKHSTRPTPKRSTPPRTSTSGGNVWKGMLLGLFIGVAVAVGVALYFNRNNNPFTEPRRAQLPPAKPAITSVAPPESLKPGAGTKQPPAPNVPSYDFYKILPGTEEGQHQPGAPIAAPATAPADAPAAPASSPAWFQVGSFQDENDADNLKAKLALIGIEASIQTTTLPERGVWHRVRVGPLKSPGEVDSMRQLLRQNGVEANLIQSRPLLKAAPAQKPVQPAPAAVAVQ